MDKIEAIDAVKRFSAAIRSTYEPLMVILYGSYASGKQTLSSDIDVAVVVDRIEGDFLDQEAGLYRTRREIDDRIAPILVEAGNDPSGFAHTIMSTGEVIYERKTD
jgi:uncharacterized protein